MRVKSLTSLLFLALFCCFLLPGVALAVERTQSIPLKKGWNAVFVQVDVLDDLNQALQNTPIKVVATYYYNVTSAEFIESPTEETWKKPSWNKWIAPERSDAFLTNLYALEGGRGYLVYSEADYDWSLLGEVSLYKLAWEPNSFTLTGFPVTALSPSVSQLVDISAVHKNQLIYTLETSGDAAYWKEVKDRVSTPLEAHKAYWVYTKGSGEYFTGAIEVKLSDSHHETELNFLDIVDVKRITLRNASDQTRHVTLTLENNQIPLTVLENDPETQERIYRPVTDVLFTTPQAIEAGEEIEVALQVDRKQIAANTTVEGLLKVTDDVGGTNSGGEYWIPMSASGDVQ